MSRSSRKRSSKWDLPEEPQFEDANIPDDGWMGKAGRTLHHKESGCEWHSPELGVGNAPKWSGLEMNDIQRSKRSLGLPSRESLPGSRSSHRNESINKGGSRYTGDAMVWDEDGNCNTRMSPGLEEWRQHRSRSPKSGWSRSVRGRSRSRSWTRSRSQSWSRSRSPDRGYRQDSVLLDRSRSRSGVSRQVCKDFAGGRCRRGSDCQLLHEDNSSYDDSWDGRHRKGSASKYSTPPITGDSPLKSGRSSVYGNDFVNGKSRREASSKFDNNRVSDGFNKGSAHEIIRERDNDRERDSDRRRRDASTERGAELEPRRSSDIPCKFFAAGNCRNKNYCRFSHHIQSHVSSERRPRDDRWGLGHSLNETDQAWNGPKWNDPPPDSAKLSPSNNTGRSRDGRWARGHNINDADQAWDDKKWSDTVSLPDSAKLGADNNGNIGVPELRSTAWPMNDNRWGHGQNNENRMRGDPSGSHEAAKRNEKEVQLWKEDKVGPKSKDTEKWLGDMSPDWNYTLHSSNIGKEEHGHNTRGSEISRLNDTSLNACKQDMSPDWNYTLQTSNNISREEHGHIARGSEASTLNDTSLKAGNQDIIREASGQVHGASVMQPMIAERSNYLQNHDVREGGSIGLTHDGKNAIDRTASSRTDLNVSANIMSHQSFDHSGQTSTAFPFPGLNSIGQSQAPIPTHTQGALVNPQDTVSAQRKSVIKLDIGDSNPPPVPNVVGGKDLTQLTSLSVSLAQLLENGHQLPQLYAALNSHNALNAPPFPKSEGSSEQLSAIQPDPGMLSQKPYDSISDSLELKKQEHSNNSASLVPNSTGKTSVHGKLEKPSDGYHQIHNSVEEPRRKSHQLNQSGGNNELGVEERKKVEEENHSPESGPLEVTDKDGPDEGKKIKEVKGIRAFKFALAEFVKDLLKPAWKDGQVSKDGYKTIVKKVVDKVTGTIPGANIPQTQEKIDSYLSFSKPKLTKLVQAYVEKMQKG